MLSQTSFNILLASKYFMLCKIHTYTHARAHTHGMFNTNSHQKNVNQIKSSSTAHPAGQLSKPEDSEHRQSQGKQNPANTVMGNVNGPAPRQQCFSEC